MLQNNDVLASLTGSCLFLAFTSIPSPEKIKGHLGGQGEISPLFIAEGLRKTQSVPNTDVRKAIVTILETLRTAAEILDWKEKNQFIRDALMKSNVPKVIEKIASGKILVPGEEETTMQTLGSSNHRISVRDLVLPERNGNKHYRSASIPRESFAL